MPKIFNVAAIGYVRSPRDVVIDDHWDSLDGTIELDAEQFSEDALVGLDSFSHIEVIFVFDRVPEERVETGARHPRGREDWPKAGIFAQRGKNRPNRLGATVCALQSIDGLTLRLKGLDAIEGTPVLDIKPVMSGFERRGDLIEPQWAKEIMSTYW